MATIQIGSSERRQGHLDQLADATANRLLIVILPLGLNSRLNAVRLMHIHHGNDSRFNHPRMLDHLSSLLAYQRACGKADGGTAKPVVHLGTSDSRGTGLVPAGVSGTAVAHESGIDATHALGAAYRCRGLRVRVVRDDMGAPDTRRELEQ